MLGETTGDSRLGPASFIRISNGIRKMDGRGRVAGSLPMTDRHRQVLNAMDPAPTRAVVLAERLGLTSASVTATLYALQDRDLVERIPYTGWRRKDTSDPGSTVHDL